ncbi:unnamed protein product [Lactuca virosa]|uniref:SWIM-type domain-containing protein n=1 Tax=Lactuca virosa TaxID=75947 RepID=A0AAU9MN20_9ASTR|nr:unnamed protein product [Lactuca virosa]
MKRFFHQGQEVAKWRGNCRPNIQLKLDEFGKYMRLWTAVPSGGDVFETRYGYNGYKVDLATHTCTCNLWMFSSIPCVHSQAAINYTHKDPSQFLSSWFHKDKYVATYSQNIQPVGRRNLWPTTGFIKPLLPPVRRMPGRPKVKTVKHAFDSQDAKYPSQRLKVPRTVRCGKYQQLGDNKIACTNDEVPKPPVPKRKIGRPRKDGGGQPIFDQFPPVGLAIPRRDVAPPPVSESSDRDGEPAIPRRDVAPPPVLESGDQVGRPTVIPITRTKMMARRRGKAKVFGSRNKTPNKTPNGKKHKSQAKEDVSLTCDEDFDDLFTHGKQPMSQAKEDVQEQENDNEVKVSERLTLKELLLSGYTHADAVAAMKEIYGEVEEIDVDERDVQEKEIEEREVEEEEVEEREVEEEEVEDRVVEEEEVEDRDVGARMIPLGPSSYNFH